MKDNIEMSEKQIVESTVESTDVESKDFDHEMEDKVLKKMDLYLVPTLAWIYFLSALDKGNIGNAQLAGLSESTKLVGNQYGNAVTVFYATYIFFEPLGSNLLKIIGPRYMMTCGLLCWGAITLGTGFINNYSQLLAVRLLLGCFESTVYPSVNMYLTICFRRTQLAKRFSYVFFASCLASSFGGLISYGCSHLDGAHGFRGWRWIYIIEGSLTLGSIPLVYFMISQKLEDSWFFTEEEKAYIVERYNTLDTFDVNEKFSWKEAKRAVMDPKTWISGVIQFCVNLTSYGMGVFFPIIIAGLGFSNVRAQLMTVPVYFLTAISYIVAARISDKLVLRSPFVLASCITGITGLSIVIGAKQNGVRYFGIFVIAIGLYVSTSMNVVWLNSNTANFFKRATSVGFNQLVGNATGVVSGQIFRTQDKPRYLLGLAVCLGGQGLAIVVILFEIWYLRRLNKLREDQLEQARQQGVELPDRKDLGDENVYFRYTL